MKIEPFEHSVTIEVEAPVFPSESSTKVQLAIRNVIRDIELVEKGDLILYGKSDDYRILSEIYQELRLRRIRSVARRLLLHNREGVSTWLYLNKQAAFADAVSLCEGEDESALGPIKVTLSSESLDELIVWMVR